MYNQDTGTSINPAVITGIYHLQLSSAVMDPGDIANVLCSAGVMLQCMLKWRPLACSHLSVRLCKATLEHCSDGAKFERQTEVKDIKVGCRIDTEHVQLSRHQTEVRCRCVYFRMFLIKTTLSFDRSSTTPAPAAVKIFTSSQRRRRHVHLIWKRVEERPQDGSWWGNVIIRHIICDICDRTALEHRR